jgi:hypothetical protein
MAAVQVGSQGGISTSPIRGRLQVPCGGARKAVGASPKGQYAAGAVSPVRSLPRIATLGCRHRLRNRRARLQLYVGGSLVAVGA